MFADVNAVQPKVLFNEASEQVFTIRFRLLREEQIDVSQPARPFDLPNAADSLRATLKFHATGSQSPFAEFLADHQFGNQ